MKQAVQIGAGNIGRGFMGAILERGGWHVTFADVADTLIDAINRDKRYTVHILDHECYQWEITNISAVSSKGPELAPAIAQCDLITTAVGPSVLPVIAVNVAEGIRARIASGNRSPMNVICCENGLRTTTRLKNETFKHLSEEEIAFCGEHIGFADCAVDRICPRPLFDNPLDVAVEEYTEWDVEQSAWKGELLSVKGLTYTDNLMACLERKLFTLNSAHAVCAYLGYLKGCETVLEAMRDDAICHLVHRGMQESGEGLIRKYGFDRDAHYAYVDRTLRRLLNPRLRDEILRVGREPIRKLSAGDRLIKPLVTSSSYGLPVDHLIYGAAAALYFNCPDDPESAELQSRIEEDGVGAALAEISGLEPGGTLHSRILEVYRALGYGGLSNL